VLMSTVRAFGRYAIVTPIFSWASKASDGGPAGEKASFTASYFHMGKTKVTELVVMRSRCRIWCSLLSVLRLNSLREHHPCCHLAGRSNPGMPSLLLYPVPRGNLQYQLQASHQCTSTKRRHIHFMISKHSQQAVPM